MSPSQKAKIIRENAKELIREKKIEEMIGEIGELVYTGSYALDLMTWNDLDLQIVLKKGLNPVEELGKVLLHFAYDPDIIETQMIHFKGDYKPKMPRGIYLGIQLNTPRFGGLWKIDLWVLQEADFEENRELIRQLESRLTPNNRELILEIKHELMKNNRIPQRGSHVLYQAVLFEGITEKKAIYRYLENEGVKLA